MVAGDPGGGITRAYLEAHAVFFINAAVTILFLHNWFALLAQGGDYLEGNHQAWIIWAIVDTWLPIVLGVTGCRLWQKRFRSVTPTLGFRAKRQGTKEEATNIVASTSFHALAPQAGFEPAT